MHKTYTKREISGKSPSKRWTTTASSALEEVAAQLAGSYDRSKLLNDLQVRKLANTKTSINFGNEKVNYTSDAKENQLKCMGGNSLEDRIAQAQRIKAMKAELTTTNFKLGDENPDYLSANQLAMKTAEKFKGTERVAMNVGLKEAVKKSSIHFGNEPVSYTTTAQEGMRYLGNENNFAKLKEEVKDMTATLRKHNFSFGDEKVSYQSDYNSGYGSLPMEAYRVSGDKKAGMRAIIEDSRACHFSLGQDKISYESNTQRGLRSIEGHGVGDVRKSLQHAAAMKAALQKTSIVIGDDAEYY